MRTIALSLLLLALGAMGGCATVQLADPKLDAVAKSFAAPTPGKAGVYIYRNENFGAAISMDVSLDGRVLGETAAKSYFYVEVEPGSHTVRGKAENESLLTFEAVANRLY